MRNHLIHSIWGAGKEPNTAARIKMTAKEKYGFRVSFQSVTVESLGEFAANIRSLAEDVQRFYLKLVQAGESPT